MGTNIYDVVANQKELIKDLKDKIAKEQKKIINLTGELAFADRVISKVKMTVGGSSISVRDFNVIVAIIDDYYRGKK